MEEPTYDPASIVWELGSILQDNFNVTSFEIILQPHFRNVSPVLHIDHHLGLESWCLKQLYCYVHKKLLIRTDAKSQIHELTVALLLNPNVKTYWNIRKKLVFNGVIDINIELHLVEVILSYKPKVQDLFSHRKWLLLRILERKTVPNEFFFKEWEIVQKAATLFTNNQIAWNFACWLVSYIEDNRTLQTIWENSKSRISTNVSDFSGLYFHQRILMKLIDAGTTLESDFRREVAITSIKYWTNIFGSCQNVFDENQTDKFFAVFLVSAELELSENLISFYGNHESLWTYRRFLCYLTIKILPTKIRKEDLKSFNRMINIYNAECDFVIFLQKIEEHFLNHVSNSNSEYHIKRYIDWMENFEIYTLKK